MDLFTTRLHLREFRDNDLAAFWDYMRRPETHRYEKVVIPTEEAVRQELQDWQTLAQELPRTVYRLAVTVPPSDRVIGHAKLTLMFPEIKQWEIGWFIHPDHWGKGYATEAARALLDFAFKQVGVHRVVAFCNANNAASARVMEKLGMQRDGLLREALWWNDTWCDEYLYAILEQEWTK